MSDEPVCTEVTASSSLGGKVQIVKFEQWGDFSFFMSRKYTVPEDWTEEQVEDFQRNLAIKLREEIEPIAQAALDDLYEARDG